MREPHNTGLPIPTEDHEQIQLAKYLDMLGLLWVHIPNEGKRKSISGAHLKAKGLKPGAPDVLIFDSPKTGQKGLAIELKRQKGGKLSPEQEQWFLNLHGAGWKAAICKGAYEAIKLIDELYPTRRTK